MVAKDGTLLLVLALAACGGGGGNGTGPVAGSHAFERADGTFDRADYRRIMIPECRQALRSEPDAVEADARFCNCVVDHILATHDDAGLLAFRSHRGAARRATLVAAQACEPADPGATPRLTPPDPPGRR